MAKHEVFKKAFDEKRYTECEQFRLLLDDGFGGLHTSLSFVTILDCMRLRRTGCVVTMGTA